MPLHKLLNISFSQPIELLLLLLQLLCYLNQYYVLIFLLAPRPFWIILFITFANSRALSALHASNSRHLETVPKGEHSQFCKRCKDWIKLRDHHCVFTGRCVEKHNYCYFVSYVLYSYVLSTILVASILSEYTLLINIGEIEIRYSIPLAAGLVSGLFFMIFTAGLLAASFRSIVLGIYTVQEIKKEKQPAFSNAELRKLWLSTLGRKQLWNDFKGHWKEMVGEDVTLRSILLVV